MIQFNMNTARPAWERTSILRALRKLSSIARTARTQAARDWDCAG